MIWDRCCRLTLKPCEEPHIGQAVCALLQLECLEATSGCSLPLVFSSSLSLCLSLSRPVYWLRNRAVSVCESCSHTPCVCVWQCKRERDTLPFLSCSLPLSPLCPMTPPWSVFVCVCMCMCMCVCHTLAPRQEAFSREAVTQLCPDQTNASSFSVCCGLQDGIPVLC